MRKPFHFEGETPEASKPRTARKPVIVTEPCLTIPDEAWQEDGEEPMTHSRLLAQIRINGVHFHLQAIAVSVDDEGLQCACDADDEHRLVALYTAVMANGSWDTIEIRGHEYVVFATPHC